MTSEERIDELEKKIRIMEMANDNLKEQLKIVNDSIGKIYDILSIQDAINRINMMTKQ